MSRLRTNSDGLTLLPSIVIVWKIIGILEKFVDQIKRVNRLFTRRLITRCVGYTNYIQSYREIL